jgi:beta-galactosidase
LDNIKGKTISFVSNKETEGALTVTIRKKYDGNDCSLIHTCEYSLYSDGTIKMKNSVGFNGFDDLISFPRIGLKLYLTKGLEHMRWYGRGPHENYPDRKSSAFIGMFESTATDLFTPYLTPQENGARTDTRWLQASFSDKNKPSLIIESQKPFVFSALPYDALDFDQAIRPEFLSKREETILCIDSEMLGVGNASCGPPAMRKFQVPVKSYQFEFTIRLNPE